MEGAVFEKEQVGEEDHEVDAQRTGEMGMPETKREKGVWEMGEHDR